MNKILSQFVQETKKVPPAAWVLAIIAPGGFIAMGTYILTKTFSDKKEENDQRKDS